VDVRFVSTTREKNRLRMERTRGISRWHQPSQQRCNERQQFRCQIQRKFCPFAPEYEHKHKYGGTSARGYSNEKINRKGVKCIPATPPIDREVRDFRKSAVTDASWFHCRYLYGAEKTPSITHTLLATTKLVVIRTPK